MYLLFSGIARNAEVPVTGRSQRYCSNIHLESSIRSGIFDFPSVHLIQIRVMEPVPLFENNTDIYIEREVTKATVTVNHQRNISRVVKFLESRKILLPVGEYWLLYNK